MNSQFEDIVKNDQTDETMEEAYWYDGACSVFEGHQGIPSGAPAQFVEGYKRIMKYVHEGYKVAKLFEQYKQGKADNETSSVTESVDWSPYVHAYIIGSYSSTFYTGQGEKFEQPDYFDWETDTIDQAEEQEEYDEDYDEDYETAQEEFLEEQKGGAKKYVAKKYVAKDTSKKESEPNVEVGEKKEKSFSFSFSNSSSETPGDSSLPVESTSNPSASSNLLIDFSNDDFKPQGFSPFDSDKSSSEPKLAENVDLFSTFMPEKEEIAFEEKEEEREEIIVTNEKGNEEIAFEKKEEEGEEKSFYLEKDDGIKPVGSGFDVEKPVESSSDNIQDIVDDEVSGTIINNKLEIIGGTIFHYGNFADTTSWVQLAPRIRNRMVVMLKIFKSVYKQVIFKDGLVNFTEYLVPSDMDMFRSIVAALDSSISGREVIAVVLMSALFKVSPTLTEHLHGATIMERIVNESGLDIVYTTPTGFVKDYMVPF